MKIKMLLLSLFCLFGTAIGQETYKLRLDFPIVDLPQNINHPHILPSMYQAMNWSADLYELGFFGIGELGDWIFKSEGTNYTKLKKAGNNIFKYAAGLAFSKYGSELPIPLGIWGHEEFHRSVLGVKDIRSNNGNWMFDRWDGTVYGLSDETLGLLKLNDPEQLLYSYVSGLQYEVFLNEKTTLSDFYFKRNFLKSALLLYNAYYVWDYFRFSTSNASDSVKVIAPPHESKDPLQRDFAGADLTAWVYDMFNPDQPYNARDPFPEGNGVNRRIGFSDLNSSEREYLNDQKKLSFLNFLNPSIFFINRIRISDDFSFNVFTSYAPTNFGNDVAFFLPFKYRNTGYLVNMHRYGNHEMKGFGLGLGLFEIKLHENIGMDLRIDLWDQPVSFFSTQKRKGGFVSIKPKYFFNEKFSAYVSLAGKTKGWIIGNPYLNENISVQSGILLNIID